MIQLNNRNMHQYLFFNLTHQTHIFIPPLSSALNFKTVVSVYLRGNIKLTYSENKYFFKYWELFSCIFNSISFRIIVHIQYHGDSVLILGSR